MSCKGIVQTQKTREAWVTTQFQMGVKRKIKTDVPGYGGKTNVKTFTR